MPVTAPKIGLNAVGDLALRRDDVIDPHLDIGNVGLGVRSSEDNRYHIVSVVGDDLARRIVVDRRHDATTWGV